jgi:hypothetical protein
MRFPGGLRAAYAAKNSLALRFQSRASTITETMIVMMLDVTVCAVWNQIRLMMLSLGVARCSRR